MRTLEHRQISLEIPDLAEGDFEHITISSQLSVVERSLQGEPARLIGSSMGGYLASLYAAAHPKVERLVLLAPAFGFAARWQELMGPEKLRVWKERAISPKSSITDRTPRIPCVMRSTPTLFNTPPTPISPSLRRFTTAATTK